LLEIAPQLAGRHVQVLRQQAEGSTVAQCILKQRSRLLTAADSVQRVDVPKGTAIERIFRCTEVVRSGIAEQMIATTQLPFNRSHCADKARTVGAHKARLLWQQQAGIHIAAAEALDEGTLALAPSLAANVCVHGIGPLTPACGLL